MFRTVRRGATPAPRTIRPHIEQVGKLVDRKTSVDEKALNRRSTSRGDLA
jgi:hypothetical protein